MALQGTAAIIDDQEEEKAYVYMDSAGPKQTDCRDYLGNLSDNIVRATEKARYLGQDVAKKAADYLQIMRCCSANNFAVRALGSTREASNVRSGLLKINVGNGFER